VNVYKYIVDVVPDEDCQSPAEEDGWKLYSFNSRHASFRDPYELLKPVDAEGRVRAKTVGLQRKLDTGTAFLLSYYEHGDGKWMVRGSDKAGSVPDKDFDFARTAGILIWEQPVGNLGAKTYGDREKDAESFVELYSDWANGHCNGFTVYHAKPMDEDEDTPRKGRQIDSSFGFYGDRGLADAIREFLPEDATEENTFVTGDAAFLVEGELFEEKGAPHAATA
jgi:hypothetical protein